MLSVKRVLVLIGILIVLGAAGAGVFVLRGKSRAEEILLPTLDLVPVAQGEQGLLAAIIGKRGEVDIHLFSAAETANGLRAPADAHVVLDVPSDATVGMNANVALGGIRSFRSVRSWWYEYSGNEGRNKKEGKTGRDLFDGRFGLSQGELAVTGERYGYLNTTDADGSPMDILPGKRYYLMVDGETLRPGDGGSEDDGGVFRVSPYDTDGDYLSDFLEDPNGNGTVDPGETDPRDADSDGDGLSDGEEDEMGRIPPECNGECCDRCAGAAIPGTCSAGLTCCDRCETTGGGGGCDPATCNQENCKVCSNSGQCESLCGSNEVCRNSECVPGGGGGDCNPTNCILKTCNACRDGQCVYYCDPGQTCVNGDCVGG